MVNTQPTLSIIIPTWNTASITYKCIQTIQKFLPSKFTEIIIVDNGSTDDTQKMFSKIHDIIYIRNNSNLGFSKANNIGADSARGQYFMFLNSDMELTDSTLIEMVNYLELHPHVGIIGPKFLNPDLSPQGSVFPPQTPINAMKEYWLKQDAYTKFIPDNNQPSTAWAISGGALLIRHSDFELIGGWDERYFFYYEDLELCRQIRKLGKKIIYFPQCSVIHRHGASGTTVINQANQWRRLIPSSIKYHGKPIHFLINFIIWSSQKFYSLVTK